MNTLSLSERTKILACLVEGNSLRSTSRLTGSHRGAVMKLLADIGTASADYQDKVFQNLSCKRIQCDEIWAFVGCKEKNLQPGQKNQGMGDIWTWVAIDTDTKIIPCWNVGNRDMATAHLFMHNLAGRLAKRIQLTSDGFHHYRPAVESAFGSEIDYAQLVKIYGYMETGMEVRYSRSAYQGSKKVRITGKPERKHVSTSLIERQNLTMRMSMRRFTRLTNAFSKKVENLKHSVALHFMHYNFCRIHQSLRITPAMEAGLADKVWSLEDVVKLLN